MFSAPILFAKESCVLKIPKTRYRLGELGESWRIKMKMHTKSYSLAVFNVRISYPEVTMKISSDFI